MSSYRTIEPSLFDNGDLLRLGLVAQWTFTYLIGKGADDEGRFEWDPFMILRNAFSPVDSITMQQVEAAMLALSESGMVVRYGDGKFGFLAGWFEHQRIARTYRAESKLPRPPVKVASWAEAEGAKKAYCEATGADLQRASYRNAIRWATNGILPESREASQEPCKTPAKILQQEVEGEGEVTTTPSPSTSPSERRASAYAAGACSGGNDEQPKHIQDLCECLGVELLPAGWDLLCAGWVQDFGDQREGSRYLRSLVAEEASRIRAGGKRKGSPRLSGWLSRRMSEKRGERERYYG